MPDKPRPFRIPWSVTWRRAELPLPAMIAALASGLAFLSVLAFHTTARWVGIGWMAFGLLFYVVYRKVFEGTSLTKRVSVSEQALTKQIAGGRLLATSWSRSSAPSSTTTSSPPPGRLAAAEQEEAEARGRARAWSSSTWSRCR